MVPIHDRLIYEGAIIYFRSHVQIIVAHTTNPMITQTALCNLLSSYTISEQMR